MRIFSKKKKIDFRRFTLSQAIMLKTQEVDFSSKTESKILGLIYEHLKFNTCSQYYSHNGRRITIAQGLYQQYVNDAGLVIRDSNIRHEILLAFRSVVSSMYFWMEVTKSIDILNNPGHINDGRRRVMILELLQSLNNDLLLRIKGLIAVIASFVIPIFRVPFSRIPIGERERFVSGMFNTVKEMVENNRVTRSPRMTTHNITGSSVLRSFVPISNEQFRHEIADLQGKIVSEVARHPAYPANWTNVQARTADPARIAGPARATGPSSAAGPSRDAIQTRDARLMQAVNANRLDSAQEIRRQQMYKEMALLSARMDKIRDLNLNPGDTVKVYEHDDEYFTPEECEEQNIPKEGQLIVLEHISEDEYVKRCNALKEQFKSEFRNAQMFVYQY